MIDGISLLMFVSFFAAAFLSMLAIKALSAPTTSPASVVKIRADWHGTFIPNQEQKLTLKFDRWFTQLVVRSGQKLDRHTAILLIGSLSLLTSIAAIVANFSAAAQILSGTTVFAIGLATLFCLYRMRVKNFSLQLPAALELLARSVRAGEDIESSIASVSKNFDDPVASEFSWCHQQILLGMSPVDAVSGLAERIPTMDTQLFAHTIAVHRNLGGRLSDSLDRLSSVIRDRIAQEEKIRSITGIGRFAVVAIIFMAVFVLAYLSWSHPEYISKLYSSRIGRQLLFYAATSEIVGIIWAIWTLKTEL